MTRNDDAISEPHQRLLEAFAAHLEKERRLSTHTVSAYRRDIQSLLTMTGDNALNSLGTHHVRRFVARLHANGHNGRSLARALSAWRGFFDFLMRDHGFENNPCSGVRAPKTAKNHTITSMVLVCCQQF